MSNIFIFGTVQVFFKKLLSKVKRRIKTVSFPTLLKDLAYIGRLSAEREILRRHILVTTPKIRLSGNSAHRAPGFTALAPA
jgi:hypothetical protein